MQNLDSAASTALPLRPKGAGSASTDCNVAAHGTVINTIGLDQVRHIDACKLTVTA
jgi:FAD/FMN-containing dehydrogenase